MPSRPGDIHRLLMALVVGVFCAPAWGANPVAESDGADRGHASPPEGAVQQALRHLYTLPKDSGGRIGISAAPADPKPAYAPPRPVPRFSRNLAAPDSPAVAPPHSRTVGPARRTADVPDERNMRSAGLRDPRPPIRDQDGPYTMDSAVPPPVYQGLGYRGYRVGGGRLPHHTREFSERRYFDGRPGQYGYGYNDAYGDDAAGEAYRYGFNRGYDRGRFDDTGTERTRNILASAYTARDRGLVSFRAGEYRNAADAFRLASEANQGDPAAHIYAGHALFATGRYRDAARYLRRAMELQPRIVYLTYDMRDDYRDAAEFDGQLAALEEALRLSPADPDRLFVMGYVLYFGGQRERAYGPFARLARLNPRDSLAGRLMQACQPPDVMVMPPAVPRGR